MKKGRFPVPATEWSNRAPLIRHFAISLSALTAYLLQDELRVGNGVLIILGLAAVLNFQTYLFSGWPRTAAFSRALSPFFGVAGWAALAYLTEGVRSPFAAGFGLEIILSAMSLATGGTLLVTVGAVAALWTQQALLGLADAGMPLVLQTAFLVAMGGVTLLVTRLWLGTQTRLSTEQAELAARLRHLEGELEATRVVGKVGENVARLAHGLKNAVHSLRGFVSLIEPEGNRANGSRAAIEGLRSAIDRLEELARLTLGTGEPVARHGVACTQLEALQAIEEAAAEIRTLYPEIRWVTEFSTASSQVAASRNVLREVVQVLLRNAAEAMRGRGEIVVQTLCSEEGFKVQVRDHGCGLEVSDLSKMFKPGYTTKPDGNGFGLYLARRLLEAHGGRISAAPAAGGGALLSVTLPVQEA